MGPKFKKKEIILNGTKYQAESIIGQGQYGVIYLGKTPGKKANGDKLPKEVAIKEYFYSRFRDQEGNNFCDTYWKKEVINTDIQGKFPASQMKLIDSGIVDANNSKSYFLVLSFIPGKSIKAWYDETYKRRPQLTESDIALLTDQILIPIARHLEFCHNKGLIHRDLSIDNVLIMTPKKNIAIPTIIDWGAAKLRDPRHVFNPPNPYMGSATMTGTAFMNKGTPPEIIGGMEPIAASDIYMFGHLCYYIFTGGKTCRTPALKDDYILHPKKENPAIADEYDQLIAKCTQYEPANRIKSMSDIIHALEKLVQKVTPSQITGFLKPKTFAPTKNPSSQYARIAQITNQMSSSPNVTQAGQVAQATTASGGKVSPYNHPFPMQGIIGAPAGVGTAQPIAVNTPTQANPINLPRAIQIPREVLAKSNVQPQPIAENRVSNPINIPLQTLDQARNTTPSTQPQALIQTKPAPNQSVTPTPHPTLSPKVDLASSANTAQNINSTASTPVITPPLSPSQPVVSKPQEKESPVPPRMQFFTPTLQTTQYGQAFITYFSNPKWEYLRQDTVETYYSFFDGVLTALKQKKPLIFSEKVQGNVYFIGRTIGSLNEMRQIAIYLQKVFQKAPQTRAVFLGNFFNSNRADLESFTYILALVCMYPNNIILLRGTTEEQEKMEHEGLRAHLNLKFGAYADHIFRKIVEVITQLDLLYIAEFNSNLRVLATSGGIPFTTKRPMDAVSLGTLEDQLLARGVGSRDLMDDCAQSILWGVPNELADSTGADSDGNMYFSWSYLQKFLQKNQLHYIVRSDTGDMGGHRVVWSIISGINSSSLERNKLKKEAKVLRMSQNGLSDLLVKELQFYFDRDYATN